MHSPDASLSIPTEVTKAPEVVKPSRLEQIKQPLSAKAAEIKAKIGNFFAKAPKQNPDVLLQDIAGETTLAKQSALPEATKPITSVDTAATIAANQHHEKIAETSELPVSAKSEDVTDQQNVHADSSKVEAATDTSVVNETADNDAVAESKIENDATTDEKANEVTMESEEQEAEKTMQALEAVTETSHDIRALQLAMTMMHHLKDPATLIGIGSVAVSLLATRFNTPLPPGVIERAAGAIGGFAGGYSFGKDQDRFTRLRNGAIGAVMLTIGMEGLHNAPSEVVHKAAKGLGVADDFVGIIGTVVKDKIPGLRRSNPATIPTQ